MWIARGESWPSIILQKSLSNWKSIYLNRVNLASSGTFRCEVSAEGLLNKHC